VIVMVSLQTYRDTRESNSLVAQSGNL